MPKVLCKLLNASDYISGVKFVTHQDGMLSEEIGADAAAAFLEIPGYELAQPVKTAAELAAEQRAADLAAAEEQRLADEALAEQARLADIQAKEVAEQKRLADEADAAELAAKNTAPPAGIEGGVPPAGETKEPTEAEVAAAAAAQKAAEKKAAKQAAAAAATKA